MRHLGNTQGDQYGRSQKVSQEIREMQFWGEWKRIQRTGWGVLRFIWRKWGIIVVELGGGRCFRATFP